MVTRTRGAKLPTNFIKIAIILFTSDTKKSSTEIREYLKKRHKVTEPRGIRKHLAELYNRGYLDKRVKIGIGSYYTWKKSFDSFKKIANFITENTNMVKQVEIENNKNKEIIDLFFDPPSKFTKPLSAEELKPVERSNFVSEVHYLMNLKDIEAQFDSVRYWFNTNYAISMIDKIFVKHFVDQAYNKCIKNSEVLKFYKKTEHKPITKKMFMEKCLSSQNEKNLAILMKQSPSLVLYVINLEETFQKIMTVHDYPDKIFPIVIKDMFSNKFYPHEPKKKEFGFKKTVTKDGKFDGWGMYFECNLGKTFHPNIVRNVSRIRRKVH